MEVKTVRKVSIYDGLGGKPVRQKVCKYWLAGRCNRYPCGFIHSESLESDKFRSPLSGANDQKQSRKKTWRNPNYFAPMAGHEGREGKSIKSMPKKELIDDGKLQHNHMDQEMGNASTGMDSSTCAQTKFPVPEITDTDKGCVQVTYRKQCKYWINGNCVHGDNCLDLHGWFYGSGFTMLTKLEGHCKAISGISLPSGHDKLYSVDNNGCVHVWDCNSGQWIGLVNLDGEVGCLITDGPWIFAGLDNSIKAWNLQSQLEFNFIGSGGLVCSMTTYDDKLFTGTEDGSMLIWKWGLGANTPESTVMQNVHDGAICSLVVGANRLYSGSRDGTIKVWDLQNLQCLQTLYGHTRDVTAVLFCDGYLLSASLDNTLKVWGATESGSMEVVYEINQDHGLTAPCSIKDAESKSVLLCSLNDDTVHLYDLPSFTERGRIFSKHNVKVIQSGIDGLFFIGNASGEMCVWQLT